MGYNPFVNIENKKGKKETLRFLNNIWLSSEGDMSSGLISGWWTRCLGDNIIPVDYKAFHVLVNYL